MSLPTGSGRSLCYAVLPAAVSVKSPLRTTLQQIFEADSAVLFPAHSHGCLYVCTSHTQGHMQNYVLRQNSTIFFLCIAKNRLGTWLEQPSISQWNVKYVWWSAYSILVLVCQNVGTLFYFNLTRDITQDYIPNSSIGEPAVKKNLDVDEAIQAVCLSLPLRSHGKGEESLLRYPFLCSNLERLLPTSPFWIELCNRARRSIACTHSQKKRVVVRQLHSIQSW